MVNIFMDYQKGVDVAGRENVVLAKKVDIAGQDYILVGERYAKTIERSGAFPLVSLGDTSIFRIESGGTPDTKNADYWDGNICWATLIDLPPDNTITYLYDTERHITEAGLYGSSAKLLPADSILVSSRATIGRIAITRCETATNQGFKNIIITDKSRQGGLLLCICSLLCPFISLFLAQYAVAAEILWALNYALTGMLTVYGVVLFADLSENALYLAGLGLICRRIGEPVGSTLGDRLAASPVILITLTSLAFILSVFCSALLWKMLYFARLPEEDAALKKEPVNDEDSCLLFIKKYDLSARERDVLCEVIKGCSNPQIAENLFISENTVKFHMKNLLKKTGTSNRTDLIRLFNESNR